MAPDSDKSLGDDATFAGRVKPPTQSRDVSLGDERTLGDAASGQDTVIDDIEVVDLEARYKIDGTLGQGGMGAVSLATDTRLDRKVAIKRILGEVAGNRLAVQRFLNEAKSIAALNHQNIVQIYDYGQAKDGPFLIMEYVAGGSLLDKCRDGALPLEEAVAMACQLCDGLAKAHDLGIIHRDIKPANVLLTKDGVPKLTDFGLAKAQFGDHGQTITGAVLGTPDFMPPEQRRDASLVDLRSDLWSLAATVYQMVTGRSPKIIRFDLLPTELTKVLGKALEDTKEDRYQSARELRDAFRVSLRATTSFEVATATGEGQCLACGEHNTTGRKFCRKCGGPLESPCLSCTRPMPLWEEICGSCGAKQSLLTEQKREEMAAEQARAEGLHGDFDFDGAIALASKLRDEPHPKLWQLRQWAEAFLVEVEKSRAQQIKAAAELADEAAIHEQAHDYLSAILVLEGVPESLREIPIPGRSEAVAVALTRMRQNQSDVRRLTATVKERLATKAFEGLLPDVERLLALQPERKDLHRVQEQLTERMKRKLSSREVAIGAARASLAEHDYENAVRSLSTISSDVMTPEVAELRNRAERAVRTLRGHMARLREGLAVKQFGGLLKTVDEALRLKPEDPDLLRVRQRIEAYEKQRVEEVSAAIENATALERSGQCAAAAGLLSGIPESQRSVAVQRKIARCHELAERRASLLGSLETEDEPSLRGAINEAREYLHQLSNAGIKDETFTEVLHEAESRASRFRQSRTAALLTRQVVGWSAVVAATGVCGLCVCGFWWWVTGNLGPPPLTNSIDMRLAYVPAGELSQRIIKTIARADEPRVIGRKTTIPNPYYIGVTEVTQDQWCRVMNSTPWRGQLQAGEGPEKPATYILREEAHEFCRRLTERELASGGIDATSEYRLPTEQEWEYACRAGSSDTYHFGSDASDVGRYEWCAMNSSGGEDSQPHEVAQKEPTKWGLYDAFGNVREICANYVRGACWTDPPERCAIARTNSSSPNGGDQYTGFRVILAHK